MEVPSLGSGGNHIVNKQARGGGNSNCRSKGILIVADQARHAGLCRGSARSRAGTVLTTRLAIQSLGVDRTPGILETGPALRTVATRSCMVPDSSQGTVPESGQLNTPSPVC